MQIKATLNCHFHIKLNRMRNFNWVETIIEVYEKFKSKIQFADQVYCSKVEKKLIQSYFV